MSSVSATFGAAIPAGERAVPATGGGRSGGRLVIVCSSRPQKKATAHHLKTRPRKTQPWDIKRKPTVYKPLPPMPPDWTLVSSAAVEEEDPEPAAEASPPPPESD